MADTEKITINLSAVDLGRIDLLTEEGFYSNRTDFIRTAIRKEIDLHREIVEKTVARRMFVVGILSYSKKNLEQHEKKNEKVDIHVVGAVHLSRDVTPELARKTISSLKVRGILRAGDEVKEALSDRIG